MSSAYASSPGRRTPGPAASESQAADDSVTVDAMAASPPPEVYEAMDVASAAVDELAARGLEVRFGSDRATGGLVVSVHDQEGNVMRTISGSDALDIAAGDIEKAM